MKHEGAVWSLRWTRSGAAPPPCDECDRAGGEQGGERRRLGNAGEGGGKVMIEAGSCAGKRGRGEGGVVVLRELHQVVEVDDAVVVEVASVPPGDARRRDGGIVGLGEC